MVTHSSILTQEIPWTDQPGGLQSMWSQESRHDFCGPLALCRKKFANSCFKFKPQNNHLKKKKKNYSKP